MKGPAWFAWHSCCKTGACLNSHALSHVHTNLGARVACLNVSGDHLCWNHTVSGSNVRDFDGEGSSRADLKPPQPFNPSIHPRHTSFCLALADPVIREYAGHHFEVNILTSISSFRVGSKLLSSGKLAMCCKVFLQWLQSV